MRQLLGRRGAAQESKNHIEGVAEYYGLHIMNLSALTTALIGLLGIAVGAWFQQFFARRLDQRRQLRELRARACIDFIKALSDLAHSTRLKREDPAATRDLSEAKARIAIYGSRTVVRAMAGFLRANTSPLGLRRLRVLSAWRRRCVGMLQLQMLMSVLRICVSCFSAPRPNRQSAYAYGTIVLMQVGSGKVVHGQVVIEGDLPEGAEVVLLALDGEETFEVAAELEAVLLQSIAQGERGETIPAAELLREMRSRE